MFSPVLDYSNYKASNVFSRTRSCIYKRFDFQNAFLNRIHGPSVYMELSNVIYKDETHATNAMKLERSTYGLKYDMRTWYDLLESEFARADLT